jgi:hypothetical protein
LDRWDLHGQERGRTGGPTSWLCASKEKQSWLHLIGRVFKIVVSSR